MRAQLRQQCGCLFALDWLDGFDLLHLAGVNDSIVLPVPLALFVSSQCVAYICWLASNLS